MILFKFNSALLLYGKSITKKGKNKAASVNLIASNYLYKPTFYLVLNELNVCLC